MNKAYKYRLYPDCDQEQLIKKTFGCVRYIYNKTFTKLVEYEKNVETIAPKEEKILGLDYSSQDAVH